MQLPRSYGFPWKILGLSILPKGHLPDKIWSYTAFSPNTWCNIRANLLDWLSEATKTTLHPSTHSTTTVWLPTACGGITQHSQTTSAKSDQSSVQMLSKCVPQWKKGTRFYAVLPHHISKETNKTGHVFLSCLSSIWPSLGPVTAKDTHCYLGLSLQAEYSLWVGMLNQQCDEVKICPGKFLLMDVCKEISTKNCKEWSKTYPYRAILSTAFLCPPQRPYHGLIK